MRILLQQPKTNEGTGYYRSTIPLANLVKKYDATLIVKDVINLPDIVNADVLFLLRPSGDENAAIAAMAMEWGTKVWVDYDDDLFNVPKSSQMHDYYQLSKVRKNMEFLIGEADLCTVSTKQLERSLGKYRPKGGIRVLPNALDPQCLKWAPLKEERTKIVLWRGTNTHEEDIAMVEDILVRTASINKRYLFAFFGYRPWRAIDQISNSTHLKVAPLPEYMKAIRHLAPEISIVPLVDNALNRSKSCIAAIEAAYCGSVPIVPEWEEWNLPGALTYTDKESFEKLLQACLSGQINLKERWSALWQYVSACKTLDYVTPLRVEAIESVMDGKKLAIR